MPEYTLTLTLTLTAATFEALAPDDLFRVRRLTKGHTYSGTPTYHAVLEPHTVAETDESVAVQAQARVLALVAASMLAELDEARDDALTLTDCLRGIAAGKAPPTDEEWNRSACPGCGEATNWTPLSIDGERVVLICGCGHIEEVVMGDG